ncbi:MAG: glycosyltransferase [Chloroflexota bacterium]|nr:glycosyltransferase [Chloroflexota bacterium]
MSTTARLPLSTRRSRKQLAVTVVVPVRDGGSRLLDVLQALESQTLGGDRFEVVIGDDGSKDEVAEKLPGGRLNLKVVRGAPANSYVARNRAARAGNGDVLAFCDADCVPASDWLEMGLAALEAADVVVGDIRWEVPAAPTSWTLLDIEMHVNPAAAVKSGRCLGGNLFVKRDLFERVGGFDESLPSGGDDDFGARCVRVGARLVFAPSSSVAHPTHNRAEPLLRKVWRVNYATGVREGRIGTRPRLLRLWLVPTVGMIRSRRRIGRSLSLDQGRLAAAGAHPGWLTRARALALLYLVIPYVGRIARSAGQRKGRSEPKS